MEFIIYKCIAVICFREKTGNKKSQETSLQGFSTVQTYSKSRELLFVIIEFV